MKYTGFNTDDIPVKNIDRELVSKKLDNLKDLQYLNNIDIVNTTLLKWRGKHPENETLKDVIRAIVSINFYVNELQNERHLLMLSMDEYRADKLRAVARARRAETRQPKKD